MARKLDLVTPDLGPVDSENPDGKLLNEGVSDPGTPLLAEERNTIHYFFSRLMAAASLTFNGIVDNFDLSQYFDALVNFFHGGIAVDKWDSTEAALYESAGYIVQDISGKHYTSTGKALNEDKDPADPVNDEYWFPSPGAEKLEYHAKSFIPLPGGFHIITDRADPLYRQNILVDQIKKGAQNYDFDLVMLDGTVITGDTHLEDDIFKIGTADEYPRLAEIATFNLAVWTLKDMGEYIATPQSGVGGQNDVIGELNPDRMQGHRHAFQGGSGAYFASTSAFGGSTSTDVSGLLIFDPITDGVNGVPRTGITTRPKEWTTGIIPMVIMHKP